MTDAERRDKVEDMLFRLHFEPDLVQPDDYDTPNRWELHLSGPVFVVYVTDLLQVWRANGVDGVRAYLCQHFDMYAGSVMENLMGTCRALWKLAGALKEEDQNDGEKGEGEDCEGEDCEGEDCEEGRDLQVEV